MEEKDPRRAQPENFKKKYDRPEDALKKFQEIWFFKYGRSIGDAYFVTERDNRLLSYAQKQRILAGIKDVPAFVQFAISFLHARGLGVTIGNAITFINDIRQYARGKSTPSPYPDIKETEAYIKSLRSDDGRTQYGDKNGMSKLTYKDVDKIRKMRVEGEKLRTIADKFGVSVGTISKIITGRTWKVGEEE